MRAAVAGRDHVALHQPPEPTDRFEIRGPGLGGITEQTFKHLRRQYAAGRFARAVVGEAECRSCVLDLGIEDRPGILRNDQRIGGGRQLTAGSGVRRHWDRFAALVEARGKMFRRIRVRRFCGRDGSVVAALRLRKGRPGGRDCAVEFRDLRVRRSTGRQSLRELLAGVRCGGLCCSQVRVGGLAVRGSAVRTMPRA